MDRDTIIRLAREAGYIGMQFTSISTLERFAALIEEHLKSQGYRQCAKGQRTTQFCGMLQEAVKAEREECAKMAEAFHRHGYDFTGNEELHEAIRSRT